MYRTTYRTNVDVDEILYQFDLDEYDRKNTLFKRNVQLGICSVACVAVAALAYTTFECMKENTAFQCMEKAQDLLEFACKFMEGIAFIWSGICWAVPAAIAMTQNLLLIASQVFETSPIGGLYFLTLIQGFFELNPEIFGPNDQLFMGLLPLIGVMCYLAVKLFGFERNPVRWPEILFEKP